MGRIFREFKFDAKATTVATPVLTVLEENAASARTSRI